MTWHWWWTLLAICAGLALIGCLSVGVDARYDAEGFFLSAKLGPVRLRLLPRKKKQKKKSKPRKTASKPRRDTQPRTQRTPLLSGGLSSIMRLLELGCQVLGDLRRKLRVETLTLFVCVPGADDPAKAAINYGRAWAAIGAINPLLERLFIIKKRDIQPTLDYNTTTLQVQARLVMSITIGRALALAVRAGIGFLRLYATKKAV